MVLTAVYMLVSILAPSGADGAFTERELKLIDSRAPSTPMRLYLNDNPEDLEILREVCGEVTPDILDLPQYHELLVGLTETVTDPENTGVGIAAPQVGINKRIIAVQRFDKEDEPLGYYLNPKIVSASGQMVESDEGCLSVPDGRGCVMRHASIVIEYNDARDFTLQREEIEGFTAIIFQHEIDHLDGILFTDKLINPTPDAEI